MLIFKTKLGHKLGTIRTIGKILFQSSKKEITVLSWGWIFKHRREKMNLPFLTWLGPFCSRLSPFCVSGAWPLWPQALNSFALWFLVDLGQREAGPSRRLEDGRREGVWAVTSPAALLPQHSSHQVALLPRFQYHTGGASQNTAAALLPDFLGC